MKKINKLILSCLLIVSSMLSSPEIVSAGGGINNIINHISFSTTEAYVGTGVSMDVTFSEKDDYKIKENDTVVIPLPKGNDGESNFSLKGKPFTYDLKQGDLVLARVSVETDQVVITFTKEAAELNQVQGEMRAHLTAHSDYQGTQGKNHIITTDFKKFNVPNQSINIVVAEKVTPGPSDYPFFYKGGYTGDNPSIVNWYLNTNLNRDAVEGNVILKDRLKTGHYLLVDTLRVTVHPFDGERTTYPLDEFKVAYPEVIVDAYNGGLDIFIPFSKAHYTSYEFQYQSKVTSATIENLENGVDITYYENGKEVNLHESAQTVNELFTGSIQGQKPQKGYLRVFKYVEDTDVIVAGNLFNIYHNNQLIHANLATNANGYFDVALAPGKYQVKEVKTSEWLELNTEPKEITLTENQDEGSLLSFRNQRKTIDLKVNKKWHASKEQIQKDKEKVKVGLVINGIMSDQIKLFDENYQALFENLPLTDINGEKIEYAVREIFEKTIEDNYISEVSGNLTEGFKIDNYYNGPKAQIRIPVTKIWKQGPKLKPEIAVEIIKVTNNNGEEKRKVVETLNFPTTSESQMVLLSSPHDKYDERHQLIKYELREKMSEATAELYDVTIDQEKKTVTNHFKNPLQEIEVTKQWDHKTNSDLTDVSVVFQLYRKTELTDWESVKNAQHQFVASEKQLSQKHVFKKLAKYDELGNSYEYRVEEISQAHNYQSERVNDLTIKNTYNPKITNLNILKVWENDGPEGDITLELLRNGRVIDQVILHKGTYWYTFSDLPTFDNQNKPYVYDINEVSFPDHYQSTKEIHDGGFVFFNTYEVGTTELTAEKYWVGGPEDKPNIKVQLMYTDEDGNNKPVEISGKPLIHQIIYPKTKTTFENLPKRNHLGENIKYNVKELGIDTNEYISFENGNQITNLYRTPYEEIEGTKTWIGGPIAQQSIEIQLYQKVGNEVKKLFGYKKTLLGKDALANETLSEAHQTPVKELTYSFGYLPIRNNKGQEIHYFVKEVTPQVDYIPTESKMDLTNTYQVPKTDFTVNKIWEHGPKEKPKIELYLQSSLDKKEWQDTDYSVYLKSNQRQHTFTELDKRNHLGQLLYYRVREREPIENYEVSYPDEYTTKNTYIIPKTSITVRKIWEQSPKEKPDITLALESSMDEKTWDLSDYQVTLSDPSTLHTFIDIPLTDQNGQKISYRVRELSELTDYETTYLEDNLTVINRFKDKASNKPSDKPSEKPSDKPVNKHTSDIDEQVAAEEKSSTLPFAGVSNTLVPISLLVIAIGLILHLKNNKH